MLIEWADVLAHTHLKEKDTCKERMSYANYEAVCGLQSSKQQSKEEENEEVGLPNSTENKDEDKSSRENSAVDQNDADTVILNDWAKQWSCFEINYDNMSNPEEIETVNSTETKITTENIFNTERLTWKDLAADTRNPNGWILQDSNVDAEKEDTMRAEEIETRTCTETKDFSPAGTGESVAEAGDSKADSCSLRQTPLTQKVDQRQTKCKVGAWMDTWCSGTASLQKPYEFEGENNTTNSNDNVPRDGDSWEDADLWMDSVSNVQSNNTSSPSSLSQPCTGLVPAAATPVEYTCYMPRDLVVLHPYHPLVGIPYSRTAFPVPRWGAWDAYMNPGFTRASSNYNYDSSMNNMPNGSFHNSDNTEVAPYDTSHVVPTPDWTCGSHGIYVTNTSGLSGEPQVSVQRSSRMANCNYRCTVVPMPPVSNQNDKK